MSDVETAGEPDTVEGSNDVVAEVVESGDIPGDDSEGNDASVTAPSTPPDSSCVPFRPISPALYATDEDEPMPIPAELLMMDFDEDEHIPANPTIDSSMSQPIVDGADDVVFVADEGAKSPRASNCAPIADQQLVDPNAERVPESSPAEPGEEPSTDVVHGEENGADFEADFPRDYSPTRELLNACSSSGIFAGIDDVGEETQKNEPTTSRRSISQLLDVPPTSPEQRFLDRCRGVTTTTAQRPLSVVRPVCRRMPKIVCSSNSNYRIRIRNSAVTPEHSYSSYRIGGVPSASSATRMAAQWGRQYAMMNRQRPITVGDLRRNAQYQQFLNEKPAQLGRKVEYWRVPRANEGEPRRQEQWNGYSQQPYSGPRILLRGKQSSAARERRMRPTDVIDLTMEDTPPGLTPKATMAPGVSGGTTGVFTSDEISVVKPMLKLASQSGYRTSRVEPVSRMAQPVTNAIPKPVSSLCSSSGSSVDYSIPRLMKTVGRKITAMSPKVGSSASKVLIGRAVDVGMKRARTVTSSSSSDEKEARRMLLTKRQKAQEKLDGDLNAFLNDMFCLEQ